MPSTSTSMSAQRCFTAWNDPIGRPNCTRSFAYSTARSSARDALPSRSAARERRAAVERAASRASAPPSRRARRRIEREPAELAREVHRRLATRALVELQRVHAVVGEHDRDVGRRRVRHRRGRVPRDARERVAARAAARPTRPRRRRANASIASTVGTNGAGRGVAAELLARAPRPRPRRARRRPALPATSIPEPALLGHRGPERRVEAGVGRRCAPGPVPARRASSSSSRAPSRSASWSSERSKSMARRSLRTSACADPAERQIRADIDERSDLRGVRHGGTACRTLDGTARRSSSRSCAAPRTSARSTSRSCAPQTGLITLDYGFMNTGATESAITFIDGDAGILRYRGYDIDDARRAGAPVVPRDRVAADLRRAADARRSATSSAARSASTRCCTKT